MKPWLKIQCIVFRKIDSDHEFLVLKRLPQYGGFWQNITASVEPDEQLVDAVYRELSEEAAIKQKDIILSGIWARRLHSCSIELYSTTPIAACLPSESSAVSLSTASSATL